MKKSLWILGGDGLNLKPNHRKVQNSILSGSFLDPYGDQEKTSRIRGFLDNPGELEEILRGNVKPTLQGTTRNF